MRAFLCIICAAICLPCSAQRVISDPVDNGAVACGVSIDDGPRSPYPVSIVDGRKVCALDLDGVSPTGLREITMTVVVTDADGRQHESAPTPSYYCRPYSYAKSIRWDCYYSLTCSKATGECKFR